MSLALNLIAGSPDTNGLRLSLLRAGRQETTISLIELERLIAKVLKDADLIRSLPSGCILSIRIESSDHSPHQPAI